MRSKWGSVGEYRRVEWEAWQGMIRRCHRPRHPDFPNYGGRGIIVCERWRNSFEAFYSDVGPRPDTGYSIDRVDNDGNYEPGNVRWATAKQQAANRRHRKPRKLTPEIVRAMRAEYSPGEVSQAALAKKYGVVQGTVSWIVRGYGWKHIA